MNTYETKQDFYSVMGLGVSAFISCNNTSDATTVNEDSTNSPAEAGASSNDNTTYADEIEKNSAQGNYINPKTGMSYGKLSVNRNTGRNYQ